MTGATQTCNVCGKDRPQKDLSVCQTDVSQRLGCLPGSFTQNVHYCNDDPDCTRKAPKVSLFQPHN